ncbi:MAG: response regulator [Candidatus Pacebacteria bacterium]|nr:response regulator [Candidatus Paceibacterota bacterium]
MSILTSKNILIVGEENSQIQGLEQLLREHKMSIHKTDCDSFTNNIIDDLKIDFILVNHLDEAHKCQTTLRVLKTGILTSAIPIFILTEDDSDKIQKALELGATDYVTPGEDNQSVLQKMNAVFEATDNFAGSTSIDISPIEASTTSTGIRVYVVEDDPLLRNLLSIRLDKSSFPYEFSSDGQLAVEAMHQFNPDILILDLMLPGKSGFEVLKEVKADEALKDIPVIVFSNRDGQEDRRKAADLGAVGFYVKAMTDLSELIETIETLTKPK